MPSPFTARIRDYDMSDGLKVPTNLKTYDGMSDPDDHLTLIMGTMEVHKLPKPAWCRFFHITLSGAARFWYDNLLPGSINSFRELRDKFQANFLQQRRFQKMQAEILRIRQRSDESLRDYLGRFRKKTLHMTDRSDGMMTGAFISKLRPGRRQYHTPHLCGWRKLRGDNVRALLLAVGRRDKGITLITNITSSRVFRTSVVASRSHNCPFTFLDYTGKGSKTITTDFMIVRAPSPYNVILGRPGIRQLGTIASTIHSLIKFPLESGITIIRGNVPHKHGCHQISRKREREYETTVIPAPEGSETERDNVIVNTMYPDQLVGIGTSLPTRIKQELRRILCENKDIFAWSLSDMTGIPRELAKHKLNIHPRTFPVRQKKRILAKDRNETITAEVTKLVEARILKEGLRGEGQGVFQGEGQGPSKGLLTGVGRGLIRGFEERSGASQGIKHRLHPLGEYIITLYTNGKLHTKVTVNARSGRGGAAVKAITELAGSCGSCHISCFCEGCNEALWLMRRLPHRLKADAKAAIKVAGFYKGCHIAEKVVEGGFTGPSMGPSRGLRGAFYRAFYGAFEEKARGSSRRRPEALTWPSMGRRPRDSTGPSRIRSGDNTGGAEPQRKTSCSGLISGKVGRESASIFQDSKGVHRKKKFLVEPGSGGSIPEDQPIRQILLRPENSGRLAKWAIELGEHDISYKPRSAIKGHVIADFLVECPNNTFQKEPKEKNKITPKAHRRVPVWTLYTDGASSNEGAGAGLILTDPKGNEITYVLRFEFPTSNNESEYEALIAGLELSIKLEVHHLQVFTDSLLVTNHVKGTYEAREESIKRYLEKVRSLQERFESFSIMQIPHSKNKRADVLSNHCTPFSLVYESEAVLPPEIGLPTYRVYSYDEHQNTEDLRLNLDLLEERRDLAALREARYKQHMEQYYNSKVHHTYLKVGDFVLRKNEASRQEGQRKLNPNWEGPYQIIEAKRPGTYVLKDLNGKLVPRT
ncbi:reverse transcriptase domain-containing protein [Tanacetum coccineum]